MVTRRLLVHVPGTETLAFADKNVQATVYAGLAPSARAGLHQTCGQVLEQRMASTAALLPVVTGHWRRAAEHDDAAADTVWHACQLLSGLLPLLIGAHVIDEAWEAAVALRQLLARVPESPAKDQMLAAFYPRYMQAAMVVNPIAIRDEATALKQEIKSLGLRTTLPSDPYDFLDIVIDVRKRRRRRRWWWWWKRRSGSRNRRRRRRRRRGRRRKRISRRTRRRGRRGGGGGGRGKRRKSKYNKLVAVR